MLVLLNTTVLIDYLGGKPAIERVNGLLARGDTLGTSPANVEKIFRGLRVTETDAVEQLFDGLRIVPVLRAGGRKAGDVTSSPKTSRYRRQTVWPRQRCPPRMPCSLAKIRDRGRIA